jgi:hypothetical protein
MDSFTGKLAVVTGAGPGTRCELSRQPAAWGSSVAGRDLNPEAPATPRLARRQAGPQLPSASDNGRVTLRTELCGRSGPGARNLDSRHATLSL